MPQSRDNRILHSHLHALREHLEALNAAVDTEARLAAGRLQAARDARPEPESTVPELPAHAAAGASVDH